MTVRAGRYFSEVTIRAYGRGDRPGNVAAIQTWLSRGARHLFHDHMLLMPVITQHPANLVNEIRGEFEVSAAILITLCSMCRVIGVDLNRRVAVKVTSKNSQLT